jgi:hypothetical protein
LAITSRGETYLEMKRYGEALADFHRAAALAPGLVDKLRRQRAR